MTKKEEQPRKLILEKEQFKNATLKFSVVSFSQQWLQAVLEISAPELSIIYGRQKRE